MNTSTSTDRQVFVNLMSDATFFERCIHYASGRFHSQLLTGDDYNVLNPVFTISFMEEKLRHQDAAIWDTDHLIARYELTETRTGEIAPQTIIAIFAELERFTKAAAECLSERDYRYEMNIMFNRGEEKGRAEEVR